MAREPRFVSKEQAREYGWKPNLTRWSRLLDADFRATTGGGFSFGTHLRELPVGAVIRAEIGLWQIE